MTYQPRPLDDIREAYVMMLGMRTWVLEYKRIDRSFLVQLMRCKSDECRRLILGVSK